MQTSTLLALAALSMLPLIGLFGLSGRGETRATALAPTGHTRSGTTMEIATFAAG